VRNIKSKDTQFAVVKLPKFLEGPHNTYDRSTNSSRTNHRSRIKNRDGHSSTHDMRLLVGRGKKGKTHCSKKKAILRRQDRDRRLAPHWCVLFLRSVPSFKSRIIFRNSIGPVCVGTTTTLLTVRALTKNCRCVYSICQRRPTFPPPSWL